MKKSRFTDEQIIGFLKQAEAGMPVKELCRSGGFSDATFYKWRAKYGGMEASDASKLRDLESENAKLKKLLAEAQIREPQLRCDRAKHDDELIPQVQRVWQTNMQVYGADTSGSIRTATPLGSKQ